METKAASLTERFEAREGYAFAQLAGEAPLDVAVAGVTRAIIAAREQRIKRLLVDATQLTGFPSPSIADRYWIMRGWAEASQHAVELALVIQQHHIDPDRFGVKVAHNLGVRANVFASKLEALTWLLDGSPAI